MSGEELGPEKTYFAALQRGEFLIQKCGACERHVFYPRVLCSYCGSSNLSWVRPTGHGTVYSTTVARGQNEGETDRNIVLVDLDEGVRLMSRVEGIPASAVSIGMRVVSSIVRSDSGPLLVFYPAEIAHA